MIKHKVFKVFFAPLQERYDAKRRQNLIYQFPGDVRVDKNVACLRWLPTVLIVQHTIVLKNPLFYHLAKYDHETRPHNCYNIANYEK